MEFPAFRAFRACLPQLDEPVPARAMAAAAAAPASLRRATPIGNTVDEPSPCDVALDTWLDTLVAATRPELVWTAASVCAALEWAARVEQLYAEPATDQAACVARVQSSGIQALLADPPAPQAARLCFLTTLLRSQQLWHGHRVTPLLDVLESEQAKGDVDVDRLLAGLILPVTQLLLHRSAGGDTSRQLAEALQRAVLDEPPCVRCAANPATHAPSDHLRSVPLIALAASVSAAADAQLSDVAGDESLAWQTVFGGLTPPQAACAACLYLATRAHSLSQGDGAQEEDVSTAYAECPAAAFLLSDTKCLAATLRPLPPWLAALACDTCPALCTAYVACLLTRPEDGQGAVTARNGAQRLRCCLAAGPTARAAAQAAMHAAGCWTHDAGSDALS